MIAIVSERCKRLKIRCKVTQICPLLIQAIVNDPILGVGTNCHEIDLYFDMC